MLISIIVNYRLTCIDVAFLIIFVFENLHDETEERKRNNKNNIWKEGSQIHSENSVCLWIILP